jgi:hypothetical protein
MALKDQARTDYMREYMRRRPGAPKKQVAGRCARRPVEGGAATTWL